MSNPNGTISDGSNGGIPTADSATVNDSGTQGRVFESEILRGIDTESPDRIKIDSDIGIDGGTTGGKRRGRKPGSKNRKPTDDTDAKESIRLESIHLKDILMSLHHMGASFFQTPDLALDPVEAEQLANAIAEVGKYHAMAFDPKKVAYFNLAMVAGSIYGSRFVAIRRRIRDAKPRVVPTPIKSESVFDAQDFHMNSMSSELGG